jgi:SPP1 gp7 family putative phage head morphogenesis protein
MERIAKETYEGKLKKGQLDAVHIKMTYNELLDGATKGNKNWLKTNKATGLPDSTALRMQKNLFGFSGAKNYVMLKELNANLVIDGKIQSWEQFKRKALAINKKYNANYLRQDYQTAKQSALQAQNWQEYVRSSDKYKNLQYKTQKDNKVREQHEKLHDIIKPINDAFWDTNFPPNGYGPCRCYVVQTNEAVTSEKDMPTITEKDTPKEFRNNVGKTGQTFKESTGFGGKPHPFIAIAKNEAKESEVNKLFFKLQQAKAINKLVEKTTTHADIVNKIEFNKTSLKHAFNQPHKKYDLKNQMLPFIDTLIPKSEYLGFSKFKESDAFAGSHIFKTVIDNVESYIIVRETKWGKLVFYAISDSKKVALNLKK